MTPGPRAEVQRGGRRSATAGPPHPKTRVSDARAPQTITSNHVWADLGHFKVFDFFRKKSVRRGHGSPEAGAAGRREGGRPRGDLRGPCGRKVSLTGCPNTSTNHVEPLWGRFGAVPENRNFRPKMGLRFRPAGAPGGLGVLTGREGGSGQ